MVEVGYLHPNGLSSADELHAGEVGFLAASIKNVRDVHVGDTVTTVEKRRGRAPAGVQRGQIYGLLRNLSADGSRYDDLREALEKLQLNDAALNFEAETSVALGLGSAVAFWACCIWRSSRSVWRREYNLDLVTTAPSVEYKVVRTDGTELMIDNPTNLPDASEIEYMEEPIVKATILTPKDYVGSIMELCQERRGAYLGMEYLDESRVQLNYDLPLNEIIYDFFDALKSRTRGYASFDYEFARFQRADLVKLDMLLNGEMVDALSFIVHKERAYGRGRRIARKAEGGHPAPAV